MSTWFSSDLHIFHDNIIEYEDRPFGSVEEMNEGIIERWNSKIKRSRQHVYILGDVSFKGKDELLVPLLDKMNGVKHLILGNHDMRYNKEVLDCFESVQLYKRIKLDKRRIVLFHYPIRSWHGKSKGALHLYGHIHKTKEVPLQELNALNVGVDIHNYYPISYEEVIEKLKVHNQELVTRHERYSMPYTYTYNIKGIIL